MRGNVSGKEAIAGLIMGERGSAGTVRMSAEDRLNQIVDVAVDLIGRHGYNGMSLQDIANEIGVSQTAVIHRVKNKQNLLVLVIERYYDRSTAERQYLAEFQPGGAREGERPHIPEVLRRIVSENARRPELVRLFQMLNAEAMSPEHPAHRYFVERTHSTLGLYQDSNWEVPEGIDGEFVYSMALAAMYGLEGRWVADPEGVDYEAEWKRYDAYLFPSPTWDGYR